MIRTIAKLTDKVAGIEQLDLSGDRQSVYAALLQAPSCPDVLVRVRVLDGFTKRIGSGSSVAISPDGRRLAYFYRGECEKDPRPGPAIVVRRLSDGHQQSFAVSPLASGVGGSFVLNWSPDGRYIAFDGDNGVRLLDTTDPDGGAHARLVLPPRPRQQAVPVPPPHTPPPPSLPPQTAPPPSPAATGAAPPGTLGVIRSPGAPAGTATDLHSGVFLDAETLVGLIDCCIGPQHLVAVDLATGAERPFLDVDGPTQGLRFNRGMGRLAFVTARQEVWSAQAGAAMLVWSPATAVAG